MESLSQYSKDVREELKLSLQEVYNRTDIDVTLWGYKMFDLESRRYIGKVIVFNSVRIYIIIILYD